MKYIYSGSLHVFAGAKKYYEAPYCLINQIIFNTIIYYNKPGTAQVGAISKAQKDSKTTFSTTGDNKSSQKTKN